MNFRQIIIHPNAGDTFLIESFSHFPLALSYSSQTQLKDSDATQVFPHIKSRGDDLQTQQHFSLGE